MTPGVDPLRAFERARWARQVNILQAWLATLGGTEPRRDALRSSFAGANVPDAAAAQMRFDLARDLERLHAAIEGKTPSAVDPARTYASARSFARDEAVHTLDNAAVFLRKASHASTRTSRGAEVERAQRWIQRLGWELVDTDVEAELPLTFSAEAIATSDPDATEALIESTQRALETLRERLLESTPAG